MSNVISLASVRESRHFVHISFYMLNADYAEVDVETSEVFATIPMSRYDAEVLKQRFETSNNPKSEFMAFIRGLAAGVMDDGEGDDAA